jgi:3-oxoacyl-[acyl-carrier protein] reductase
MDITGWSAISPYGLGRSCFAAGIRSRRPAMTWADPAGPASARACLVPGFDQREVLGRAGTKGMDRLTGLAVHVVGPVHRDRPGRDTAVVLGTTAGSVRSMMDFTRASLTGERPFDVDPATIPSVVMNTPAGHCAIWHGITGPNATIASGRASGLLGLSYARRLLRTGRASTVLCGAAEEYSTARSWLSHHGDPGGPLGEGAAVLRLEHEGAPGALATVLALDSRLDTVTAVAGSALRQAGTAAEDVWAVVTGTRAERDELAGVFGIGLFSTEVLDRVPPVRELIGDTGAVCAVFQVAAALAAAAAEPGPRLVLVTIADPLGTTAAAVLRLRGNEGSLKMGRIALVSGGSRGIGAEVVLRLAADGWDIAFCYQSDELAARQVEKTAGELGARVLATEADVTDPRAVTTWVTTVEEELGPVRAVVSCAGIARDKPLALMQDADWRAVIDTNLDGVFNLCRAAVLPMMKRRHGQIVTISSVSGVYGNAGQASHAPASAGIIGFTKALAKEAGRFGIRVNVVAPGMIAADMTAILPDKTRTTVTETIALRRFGTAREVADLVALLLSGQASYLTGSVVEVHGGIAL